jgi:hypothetical protein
MSRGGDNTAEHHALVADVLTHLSPLSYCRVWPFKTGLFKLFHSDQVIFIGLKGAADITGIIIGKKSGLGIRIEFEIKTGDAVQEEQQEKFESMINSLGGAYRVIRSLEDALEQARLIHENN